MRALRLFRLSLASALLLAGCPGPSADPVDAGIDGSIDAQDDTGADGGPLDVGRDAIDYDGNFPVSMPIYVTTDDAPMAQAFAENLPMALEAGVRASSDPVADVTADGDGTTRIALVRDTTLEPEAYRLERVAHGIVVRGGGVLGEQYGLAALLEAMNVRFFHPDDAFVPATLATPDPALFDVTVTPEIAQRGFMPWTLHPIESFFVLWEPSDEHLREAERIIDWALKNGANFLSYPGLDNIAGSADQRAAWTAHTQAIVAYAHMRGMRVGIGLQLFGGASLQRAFTLVPSGVTDVPASIAQRLSIISPVPFDEVNLSFGEFSGEDPQTFIDTLNLAYASIQTALPGATVTGTIHVGDFPSTHVTYMGNDLLYYFLVQYADPRIVPWVHTVMAFNLFEPVSGAYGHTEFDAHREYLFSRLAAHQPVTYQPEDAYWITYDDSVPIYLPLYVRSRLLDLSTIRTRAMADGDDPLRSHVIFSSGWEWGYWQNDWSVLHACMHLPASAGEAYHDMLDPLPQGSAVADIVTDLIEIEHRAFIDEELSAYTAGTDATFAVGLARGVWSEPRRPSFDEVVAMTPAERTTFRTDVVARLSTLETDLMGIEARLAALSIDPDDRWLGEIVDGVHITRVRVHDAVVLWGAAADLGDGMNIDASLALLPAIEAEAADVVAHRLAHFHAPNGTELVAETRRSALIYQYGYLRHANNLCFYRRERIELTNLAHDASAPVPNCVL